MKHKLGANVTPWRMPDDYSRCNGVLIETNKDCPKKESCSRRQKSSSGRLSYFAGSNKCNLLRSRNGE